jgi:hypothetical protein
MMWLREAAAIGYRLQSTALRDGPTCTWLVNELIRDGDRSRRYRHVTAGPALYQGAAGIGLFLSECSAALGDAAMRRDAEAAFRYAAEQATRLPGHAFGLHSGRTGIALAMARHAILHRSDEFDGLARQALEPLLGNERSDRGLDVIGGAAGAIPVFLRLGTDWRDERYRAAAIALAEMLVERASWNPDGCSWPSPYAWAVKDLTGYAHGNAGFVHALVEAFAASGDPAFHYAAVQAQAYNRAALSVVHQNWLNYRHEPLANEVRADSSLGGVRAAIQRGELTVYEPHCSTTWCHGAPGVAAQALRVWQLIGDPAALADGGVGVRTTARVLRDAGSENYSLCHGACGNAMILLESMTIAPELGDFRGVVEEVAARGAARAARDGRWIAAISSGEAEPSLMLGEAGIGLFLLRLAGTCVDNPLLCTMRARSAPPAGTRAAAAAEQHRHLASLRMSSAVGALLQARGTDASPSETARTLLQAPCDQSIPDVEARVELHALALWHDLEDRSLRLMLRLVRPPWETLDATTCAFVAAPHIALLLRDSQDDPDAPPDAWVVIAEGPAPTVRSIGPLPYAVLASLSQPMTAPQIADTMPLPSAGVLPNVVAQLAELYAGRLILTLEAARMIGAGLAIKTVRLF